MAVGLSSLQLLVLSGLLQDKGLRVPKALTDRIAQLKDTAKLSGRLSYIAWHPQNTAQMTQIRNAIRQHVPGLAGVVPATYTRTLPETLRPFDVVGSIKTRADNLLGNGLKGLLENFAIVSGELQKSFSVQASLDTYKDATFSDIHLGATNYYDVVSHGITSSFNFNLNDLNRQDRTRQTVRVEDYRKTVTKFVTAISNLGQLYDWTELNSAGSATNLVKNLYKLGLAYNTQLDNLVTAARPVLDIDRAYDRLRQDENGYLNVLKQIRGNDLALIIKTAGVKLPNERLVVSAADLLDPNKVLPVDVAKQISGMREIGSKLVSLGVNSTNIQQVLSSFNNIELADIPFLGNLKQPVPAFDVRVIQNNLISGQGQFRNATLDDILGVLTGKYYNPALDSIIAANNHFSKQTNLALMTAAASVVATLQTAGTVSNVQANSFVTAASNLRSSINNAAPKTQLSKGATPIQNTDFIVYTAAESAVVTIIDYLRQEIINGEILNLEITSNIQVSTANTIIDTFDIRNIRKAVYKINVQNGNKIDDFEAKLIHNGTSANLLIYNQSLVGTSQALGNLYFTMNTAANTCSISYATATDNNSHHFLRPMMQYTPIHDGSDPNALNGSTSEITTVYRLDEIARDVQLTGLGNLLESMANNDIYGEAILASLITSKNTVKLQPIGINAQKANPTERLAELNARQGAGLTQDQISEIRKLATTQKIDANTAIANASRYGFFVKK